MHAGSGKTARSMTNLLHECAAAAFCSYKTVRWEPAGVPELFPKRCHQTRATRGERVFCLELLQLNRLSAVPARPCSFVPLGDGMDCK